MKDYIKVLLSDIKLNNFVEKVEEALKQLDKLDSTGKIKEFINELEHNIQVDKNTDDTLISGVSCDYVIGRLKDIIK